MAPASIPEAMAGKAVVKESTAKGYVKEGLDRGWLVKGEKKGRQTPILWNGVLNQDFDDDEVVPAEANT